MRRMGLDSQEFHNSPTNCREIFLVGALLAVVVGGLVRIKRCGIESRVFLFYTREGSA